ncbi:MAG: hypothetical protein LUE17_01615 [Planctomycetaceae bacterium]|nr:hypothetical protein [Planctomycetaceae bacterium]
MDTHTTAFITAAKKGQSVYIPDVRSSYLAMGQEESFSLPVALTLVDGGERRFDLRLPRFGKYGEEAKGFVVGFFLAELYNMLSSLGGRAIRIANPDKAPEVDELALAFRKEFGVAEPRHKRRGYGRSLNVIDRMLQALDGEDAAERFSFTIVDTLPQPRRGEESESGAVEVFRAAAHGLEGKTILGMDIGGTDIKLALAIDAQLVSFREYDWFPASFTDVAQLIDPIVELVTAMAADAAARTGTAPFLFDAIGMCFPDVVVNDKIVGGEVFKTRGIRDALGADYDAAFVKLTDLNTILQPFVKPGCPVGILNDGPMAAFTAGVETAVADSDSVRNGVFAYTLGTELGTGYVTRSGTVPAIPLEVYNFIIDLGSWPERQYEPDDLRSINNFNTRLPGTLQKFACQSGVFRLALRYLPSARPDLIAAMKEKGFVVEMEYQGQVGFYVPTAPRDMRKPFLEYMMALAETDGDPAVTRIFEEIGVALAVTGEEIDWIVQPTVARRTLFGRLVKRAACFDCMCQGALSRNPAADLAVADDGIAETPLMQALSKDTQFTVAQFAQAVGAVHYGNYLLNTQCSICHQ